MHKYGVFAPTAGDLIVALVSSLTSSRQLQTPLLRSPKKLSDDSDKENSTPKPRWLRGAAAPQARQATVRALATRQPMAQLFRHGGGRQ